MLMTETSLFQNGPNEPVPPIKIPRFMRTRTRMKDDGGIEEE
jgi:hypothetical protein